MTRLSIPDMSCGHCRSVVDATIRKAAPGASVEVDLATHSATTDAADLAPVLAALAAEGYPATPAS